MPARVVTNSQGGSFPRSPQSTVSQTVLSAHHQPIGPQKTQIKTPTINEKTGAPISPFQGTSTHDERAKFYTGYERLDLQNAAVQRVRELQEENDNLQREILSKEKEIIDSPDPLVIVADIEHRQTMIARNTGEVLKIYRINEERLNTIRMLEEQNNKLNTEIISAQGKFIAINDMQQRTQIASEFFILKAHLEKNLQELSELTRS